jgi:hypothetical protein
LFSGIVALVGMYRWIIAFILPTVQSHQNSEIPHPVKEGLELVVGHCTVVKSDL